MSYTIGRRFEYKVINKLKQLNIKVIRNKLSRKPDIYTDIGLFEIKKTLNKGKTKCFTLTIEEYIKMINNQNFTYQIKEYSLDDYFYTLTIQNNNLIVIIPFYMDINYYKKIKEDIQTMLNKLYYFIFWELNFSAMYYKKTYSESSPHQEEK